MKEIYAKFIGTDGSLGYSTGVFYRLQISGNAIHSPTPCPYSSLETFLENWEPIPWPCDTCGRPNQYHKTDDGCPGYRPTK